MSIGYKDSFHSQWVLADGDISEAVRKNIVWINALFKNEHKQGVKKLGDTVSGHCVLGLFFYVNELPYDSDSIVDKSIHKYAGLIYDSGKILTEGKTKVTYLSDLNDRDRLTFPELGSVILENLHMLFINSVAVGLSEHYEIENSN